MGFRLEGKRVEREGLCRALSKKGEEVEEEAEEEEEEGRKEYWGNWREWSAQKDGRKEEDDIGGGGK